MDRTIPPTYLCIKIHTITGLSYLCKTTQDPEKYKGSGVYWKRHINKHGREHVENELVLGPYPNKSELEALALYMSIELDVVNSDEWANLKPENGLDGGGRTGVPNTGRVARGVPQGPAKGGNARGVSKPGCGGRGVPKTGNGARGVPATGKNARGVPRPPATGRNARGVPHGPNTGGSARGVPATGNNARGVLKGPQTILICPHCGQSGGNAMKRWHFDNCKLKVI